MTTANPHTDTMARAWAIFRETYHYPQMPFASIGRKCFASCLRRAWWERKEAARVAAIPAADKAATVARLTRERDLLPYMESHFQASGRERAINAILATLLPAA